jgi:hypothetical protein
MTNDKRGNENKEEELKKTPASQFRNLETQKKFQSLIP